MSVPAIVYLLTVVVLFAVTEFFVKLALQTVFPDDADHLFEQLLYTLDVIDTCVLQEG
jgi:hypothetical protein